MKHYKRGTAPHISLVFSQTETQTCQYFGLQGRVNPHRWFQLLWLIRFLIRLKPGASQMWIIEVPRKWFSECEVSLKIFFYTFPLCLYYTHLKYKEAQPKFYLSQRTLQMSWEAGFSQMQVKCFWHAIWSSIVLSSICEKQKYPHEKKNIVLKSLFFFIVYFVFVSNFSFNCFWKTFFVLFFAKKLSWFFFFQKKSSTHVNVCVSCWKIWLVSTHWKNKW